MSQSYYGGEENPYEAIKVIEAWGLNFSLGSVLKYINRHGKKPGEDAVKDLRKCLDYIGYEIARIEREKVERVAGDYQCFIPQCEEPHPHLVGAGLCGTVILGA